MDWSSWLKVFDPWLDGVNVFASVFAAISAFFLGLIALRRQNNTTEADFYLQFTARYNTLRMHEALLVLYRLKMSKPDDFAHHFIQEFRQGTPEGLRLDQARRLVNRYFVNIAEMRRNRLINQKLARMLCNFQGLNIFYKIVVPMNQAKYGNQQEHSEIYQLLRRIKSRFSDGSFGLVDQVEG
ncbi:hypothetical protein AEYBE204_18990 [Asticcacaulis sp. YBE204]|nr:hypothetical protein AEYBE204_18990 [Asticcacaulis sp. YBE204]